jgi:hypothetical protein
VADLLPAPTLAVPNGPVQWHKSKPQHQACAPSTGDFALADLIFPKFAFGVIGR